jgi:DNA-binding MarR family transcriptional regulator
VPSPAADPAVQLQRLIGLLNRKSIGESVALMHRSGLTFPQITVLFALRARGALSVSALAARLRMSLPATSQLAERLVAGGLVERTAHARDRRVRLLRLLAPGLAFLERFTSLRRQELDEALRSLGPATRKRLAAAAGAAVAELEQELEARPAPQKRRKP